MCWVLCFFLHEKAADLAPNVLTLDAFSGKHVGLSVDRDAVFLQVGEGVFF